MQITYVKFAASNVSLEKIKKTLRPCKECGFVQVDLTTAEERLQEEVGALRRLQGSFF